MEDRFRFRWWDYHDKEYTYDVQDLCEMDCFGSAYGTDCWGNPDVENADNFGDLLVLQAKGCGVIEQCTGIRDYLDKLIYEGDIIKNLRTKNSYYKVVAETNDYSFKFVGDSDSEKISCFEKYAVIGNIHENPELLEEE